MNFKTIVFDLDGTISDPSVGYLNGINFALKSLNKPVYTNQDYKNYLGIPLHISFEKHFIKDDPHLVDEAIVLFRNYYNLKGKYENTLYLGMLELIKTLSAKSDLYILTNKTHQFAIDIIEHFGLTIYIKDIYGLNPNLKISKGEIALELNKTIFKNSNNILMIGDTIHDINCAHNAHWKSCFVTYGFGNKDDLISVNPFKIVNDVDELAKFLLGA